MPSIEYEPLILFPEPNISNEEEDKGDINGVGSLAIRVPEELGDFRGRKDNLEREDVKQTLKQVESIL